MFQKKVKYYVIPLYISYSFNNCHLLTAISHYVYVEDHFHVEIICYITEGNTDSCEDVTANLWSVLDI